MARVPAAGNAMRILTTLASSRGPLAAVALATGLGLPRSSVYQLLEEMAEHGFVLHYPEERRWGLGPSAFELGGGYARQQPLARLGRPVLDALVDRVGESGHLAVLSGTDVLYLAEERAPRRPSLVTDVGVRLPAHLTATGRALLAGLPREQVRALYPDATAFAARGTDEWTYRRLSVVLERVRETGVAEERGEVTPNLASVGSAIRDRTGWPVAAIALTFNQEATDSVRVEALGTAVRDAAAALERRIRT
ncbi:MAG TPA: IclR family transcriptional regulator [Microbacteriaceae bacterium]|nr:IclR family transcriptional regulator [Microbacteriaceae bacterium]